MEAVVSVSVILVLVTSIMPILVNRKATEDRIGFTSQLNRLPVEAREDAINENATYHLLLDSQQLEIKKEDSNGNVGDALVTIAIPSDISVTDTNSAGTSSGGGSWDVKFYPDGTADQSGISFKLGQSSDSGTLALNINGQGKGTVSDTLTDPNSLSWPAGTFDQRTTTTP